MFGKRFACGCSVIKVATGGEEINIQGTLLSSCAVTLTHAGDVGDDLAEFMQEKLNVRALPFLFADSPCLADIRGRYRVRGRRQEEVSADGHG